MYCELNTCDGPFEPLNNLYANPIHAALGVSDLAATKNSFTSDGILFIKKMLTKIHKIIKIISSLSLLIGSIAILIGGYCLVEKE